MPNSNNSFNNLTMHGLASSHLQSVNNQAPQKSMASSPGKLLSYNASPPLLSNSVTNDKHPKIGLQSANINQTLQSLIL
jgi:hypothetical protein